MNFSLKKDSTVNSLFASSSIAIPDVKSITGLIPNAGQLIYSNGTLYFGNGSRWVATSSTDQNVSEVIVVGAGNAGCALARQLSSKYSVTLLEYGYDQSSDPEIATPSSNFTLASQHTNRYFCPLGNATAAQAAPSTARGPAFAGKTMGGNSAVNALQMTQGTSSYYDQWAALVGDSSWGSANVDSIYKRIQKFNGIADYNPSAHGFTGPLDVKQVVVNEQAADFFSTTTSTLESVAINVDYNDFASPIGTYKYWQVTETPNSSRADAYSAYLKSVVVQDPANPNVYRSVGTPFPIKIVTRARLQQILFNTSSGTPNATGVMAVVDGIITQFTSTKYVVLATGFQTSAYLQCSGIGDAAHLTSLGITPLIDNPNVGQHMLNHIVIPLTGVVGLNPNPFTPLPPGFDTQGLYSGGAQLANLLGDRAYQFVCTADPVAEGVTPTSFTISGIAMDMKSEGYISIFDRDINSIPIYNYNYFSDPYDITSAVAMYTKMYNVLVAMGLTPQGPDPVLNPADVITYITSNFTNANHWVGMNRMSVNSSTGVVDHNALVFGTQNLYVCDISIVPLNTQGNIQAVAYLLGNIIADKL